MESPTNAAVLRARALRRSMSPPEHLLWRALRTRPAGRKFRRQHPLGPFVADFYCAAAKLVIEVDDAAHGLGNRPRQDARRDGWMAAQGLRVIRFDAADVMNNLEAVVAAIAREAVR
ncbi:endonuclease domain-containing protein [Sphingomonas parva]|uniref:Endonuclease domain-containing protein n=2 Tax=Sphingomonas parva TaxID=2555898 RepID=A0A4Y8ZTB7_9SPHN|nr:endonuclease domain-containing protein [Sphingomonas parva]